MSGKPAARQNDMTAEGGPIVQGLRGGLIGVACSVCPGGMTSGEAGKPAAGGEGAAG